MDPRREVQLREIDRGLYPLRRLLSGLGLRYRFFTKSQFLSQYAYRMKAPVPEWSSSAVLGLTSDIKLVTLFKKITDTFKTDQGWAIYTEEQHLGFIGLRRTVLDGHGVLNCTVGISFCPDTNKPVFLISAADYVEN